MAIQSADYSNLNLDEMAAGIGLKVKHMPMLIGSFLEEAGPILSALKTAISSNDYAEIKLRAHAIKGSASNLMLIKITQISSDIEDGAKDELEKDYKYLFNELKYELEMLQKIEVLS